MAIDFEESFPAAPQQIRAALLERRTWDRYATLTRALGSEFDSKESATGVSTRFRRTMSSDQLVAPLRRLVGHQVDIHETLVWTGDAGAPSADVMVEIRRPHVAFAARLAVEPVPVGSRLSVHGGDPSAPLIVRPFMPQVRNVMKIAIGELCQAIREEIGPS